VLPEFSYDDEFIFNDVRCQCDEALSPGAAEQVAEDVLSQQANGKRTLSRKTMMLAYDADALTRAEYLLSRFRETSERLKAVSMLPQQSPEAMFPVLLGHEISSMETVKLNSERNPANLSKNYHIEGIEHSFNFRSRVWNTKWQLMDVDTDMTFLADGVDGHAGHVLKGNATYLTAHDAADGVAINDVEEAIAGQEATQETFNVYRVVLEWGTPALGDAVLESAEVWLHGLDYEARSPEGWLYLVPATGVGYQLVPADYGKLLGMSTEYGRIDCAAWNAAGWNRIPLSLLGLAAINKAGTTRFGLRWIYDIAPIEPTGNELVGFSGSGAASNFPRLVVRVAK
jgi:hypothetical protein